jgi:hypothetical protein
MMKDRVGKRRFLFLAFAALLTAAIAGAVVFSKVQQPKPRVATMPPVFSKVKNLAVVNAMIINPDTPYVGVRVQIRNNSSLAVMAVDVVAGEGGVTKNGLHDEDHPIVVIEPYGTTTVDITFSEMTPGAALVVNAATYADGTEDGAEESLGLMHKIREQDRARIKAEREKEKGGKP